MGSGAGDGMSVVSVAGTSFRYNSLQIDGAANNDLFGLASSAGAPGGTAETQPVSLDAVAELQLVVSPYDVRQGGFAGGGVNAVTKSGSNQFHGSGFVYGRTQDWVGDLNALNTAPKYSTFKDMQMGGSLGGPIAKNKLFFFGTLDYGRKSRPTGYSVSSTGLNYGNEALVDQFLNDLETLYHYTPGPDPKGEFIRATDSDKYFVRVDANIGKSNRLTVRNNTILSFNDIAGNPSTSSYRFPDNFYRYVSNTSSTVAQLNSTWGQGVNELRVTYTRVRDHRENPLTNQPLFPMTTVTIAPGRTVVAGTERYSSKNAISQDIIELNESYTKVKGGHTLTIGTHNEFLWLSNLFIRDNIGTYSFTSLANFEAGLAQAYDRSYSLTSDPNQPAAFSVNQWGFYAGDSWRVARTFTLTYGLRVDAPRFPKKPNANPASVSAFGYATDVVPTDVEWSPRVGFNWDTRGNGEQQIRGGVGMFTGRPAYVWLSNQYGNTGIDFQRIGASSNSNNKIPFYPDPNGQPSTVTGATAGTYMNEIDLIDPDFKFPSVLRGNFGYDRKLPWGMVATAEFLWSKTLQDIAYQNVNLSVNPNAVTFKARPFMMTNVTTLSNAPLLMNTDQGSNWNLSFEVRKQQSHGFFMSAAYSYGVAKSIMDGTSDQAISNWGNVYTPGSPNNIPVAISNFDPGHRISLTASYDFKIVKGARGTASVFYSGQSGRPYAMTVYGDVNNDTYGNDLAYLPASAADMTLTGGTFNDLLNWMRADPCLTELHRADHAAQRLPGPVDQYPRRPVHSAPADQEGEGRNHLRRAEPAQPAEHGLGRGAVRVLRAEQRPHEDGHQPVHRSAEHEHDAVGDQPLGGLRPGVHVVADDRQVPH